MQFMVILNQKLCLYCLLYFLPIIFGGHLKSCHGNFPPVNFEIWFLRFLDKLKMALRFMFLWFGLWNFACHHLSYVSLVGYNPNRPYQAKKGWPPRPLIGLHYSFINYKAKTTLTLLCVYSVYCALCYARMVRYNWQPIDPIQFGSSVSSLTTAQHVETIFTDLGRRQSMTQVPVELMMVKLSQKILVPNTELWINGASEYSVGVIELLKVVNKNNKLHCLIVSIWNPLIAR